MAYFKVPEDILPAIKEIGLMSEKDTNHLFELLRTAPKGKTANTFELKEYLNGYFSDETVGLLDRVIGSFGYLIARNNNIDGKLHERIVQSFLEQTKDDKISQSLGDTLLSRIEHILLSSGFLIPIHESMRVIWEDNIVLTNSNVTSEVVLLNDKKYLIPTPGLLLNKVNITYRSKGDEKEAIFVLDTEDMIILRDQLDNAIRENKQIQKSYSKFVDFLEL